MDAYACQAVRGSTIPWKYLTIANLEFAHEDKNSVCGRKAGCSVNVRSQLWKPLQRPLLATFMRKPAAAETSSAQIHNFKDTSPELNKPEKDNLVRKVNTLKKTKCEKATTSIYLWRIITTIVHVTLWNKEKWQNDFAPETCHTKWEPWEVQWIKKKDKVKSTHILVQKLVMQVEAIWWKREATSSIFLLFRPIWRLLQPSQACTRKFAKFATTQIVPNVVEEYMTWDSQLDAMSKGITWVKYPIENISFFGGWKSGVGRQVYVLIVTEGWNRGRVLRWQIFGCW